nr:unnamed protein product [Digitaria exilis]
MCAEVGRHLGQALGRPAWPLCQSVLVFVHSSPWRALPRAQTGRHVAGERVPLVLARVSGLSRARPLARPRTRRAELTHGRFPPATRQASLRKISPRSRHDLQPPTPFAHSWRPRRLEHAYARPQPPQPALAAPFASPTIPPPPRSRTSTELERRSKFAPVPPPFPNSPHIELDHFLRFLFPHFSRAPLNSPARNRDFPQNPHFRPPEHLHVEQPLRAIPNANRASQPPPTLVKATDLAGVEAAAAAPPLLHRRRPPSLLRPPNRHHSTRGELLVLFPHLSDLLPPSFGRRNAVDERRAHLHLLPFCRVWRFHSEIIPS